MSWSVETLFGLSGEAFERERDRIIRAHLDSLPPEQRNKVYLTQINLDLQRTKMTPEQFTKHIATELTENLENLGDQLTALKNIIVGPPKV